MHRYFVRFLVAALTFVVGVVISAVPIFHSTTNQEVVRDGKRRPCPKRTVLLADLQDSSPSIPPVAVTINNSPAEPLRLRYLSSNLDPSDSGSLVVQLLIENQSGQDIGGYAIDYHTDGSAGGNSRSTERSALLLPGASRIVAIRCNSSGRIQVWPAYADFSDGSRWVSPSSTDFFRSSSSR
jgi:hypothetical protein